MSNYLNLEVKIFYQGSTPSPSLSKFLVKACPLPSTIKTIMEKGLASNIRSRLILTWASNAEECYLFNKKSRYSYLRRLKFQIIRLKHVTLMSKIHSTYLRN
jgi:hypothetical protein